MPTIAEDSRLHRPDFLAQHAPEFADACAAADEARTDAAAKRAALENLERRKAELETEADRAALEALKGRGDEAEPRRLATEADAIGEQLGAAREAATQAEAQASEAARAKEATAGAARSRIADSLTARHRELIGEMAHHALALDALFEEAGELTREKLTLGVSDGLPGIAFKWVDFSRGAMAQSFRGSQVVEWARNAGVDLDEAPALRKVA